MLGNQWAVGVGFHIITGSNRLTSTRVFDDPAFLSSRQRTELSFTGVGLSLGVMRQFGPNFAVSAMAPIGRTRQHGPRFDPGRYGRPAVQLWTGHAAGVRRPSSMSAGQALVRTWSGANSDLLALGGTGAQNTVEAVSGCGVHLRSPAAIPAPDPVRRPLRHPAVSLGPGSEQGREFGVSAGSGVRFAQQRAGLDLALEYVWRSEGAVYSENGFSLSLRDLGAAVSAQQRSCCPPLTAPL